MGNGLVALNDQISRSEDYTSIAPLVGATSSAHRFDSGSAKSNSSVARLGKVSSFKSFVCETKTPLQLFLEMPIEYPKGRYSGKKVAASSSDDPLPFKVDVSSLNSLVYKNKNITNTTVPSQFCLEAFTEDLKAEIPTSTSTETLALLFQAPDVPSLRSEIPLKHEQVNFEASDKETNTLSSLTSVSSFTSIKSFTSATSIWSSFSSVSISSSSSCGYPDTPPSQNSLSSLDSFSINSDEVEKSKVAVKLLRTWSYLTSIAENELGYNLATSIAPLVRTEAMNKINGLSQGEIDQHRLDKMATTDDVDQSPLPSRRRRL